MSSFQEGEQALETILEFAREKESEAELADRLLRMTPAELASLRRGLATALATVVAIGNARAKAEKAKDDGDAEADAMSTKRLAALWKMPVTKVGDWCRTGILPAKKAGREWVIPRAALEEWLKAGGKGKVGR